MIRTPEPDPDAPNPPDGPITEGLEGMGDIQAPTRPDPTRYGDWERAGRCIDF